MFEGIENVTLDLEGEDKIVVTNADYLKSLVKLLSETPTKTLGKYCSGNVRLTLYQHQWRLYKDGKFKGLRYTVTGKVKQRDLVFNGQVVVLKINKKIKY
jgi:hypothetical protein